jgi:hypothetical protein
MDKRIGASNPPPIASLDARVFNKRKLPCSHNASSPRHSVLLAVIFSPLRVLPSFWRRCRCLLTDRSLPEQLRLKVKQVNGVSHSRQWSKSEQLIKLNTFPEKSCIIGKSSEEMHTKVWSENLKGIDNFKKPRRRWEDNIKIDFK